MGDEQKVQPIISLDDARELVMLLEAGMQEEANNKFLAIYKASQIDVYTEVGNLTRDLHNAIRDFAEDPRLKSITDVEIPDASERLRYIIEMTDKAANRTLDAVDQCTPKANELIQSIEELMPVWTRLMHGRIDRYDFVQLCHQLDELLLKTKKNASDLTVQLTEILMAQDYQDLTGQMIQKVILLVGEVEDKLVTFLKNVSPITHEQGVEASEKETKEPETSIDAQGPALSRQKDANIVAQSQDEVDDLLASLGF